MAACDFTITRKDERRPCWVDGRRAMFHRWTDSARPVKPWGTEDDETVDRFQVHNVHGLVEYEDGTVARVWPNTIQFVPNPMDWHPAAWEVYENGHMEALPFDFVKVNTATEEPPAVGADCETCAHRHDNAEFCKGAEYNCDKCTVIRCACKRCTDFCNWEPKGDAAAW